MTESLLSGSAAAPLSIRATAVVASAVVKAARQLLTDLERGRRIDAAGLRAAMESAFGASDTSGAWNWKTAYDASEAATVLFLRRHGAAMRARATSPAAMLPMLTKIANLLPTQTRRSEESESLQQFSTPIGLAFVVEQWPSQDGHYPVAAYQAAFGLSLALQGATLVWFAIPWLRTFGEHFYFLFAPPPAERDSQVALVTAPLDGAVLEASERMEW